MTLSFERGQAAEPKGHAILYFRDRANPERLAATYLVSLPIEMQLARYIPPMFAARMPAPEMQGLTVVPLPPIPETVPGHAHLARLAAARDDDLLDGGVADLGAPEQLLVATADVAQRYHQLYTTYLERYAPADEAPTETEPELDVQEVLLSLMGEQDRVAEVAKLVGRLRYAVEGHDQRQIAETVGELRRLGKYLSEKYRLGALIAAATQPGPTGQRLAELHVERCYRLRNEDYDALQRIEAEIRALGGA
ncbi:MAG: hypothetical protein HYY04_09910 [Chloroflexi bacterium]|nr:hypothetical protein [Chloroflexota bacterium]